jgi:hypothetical protein
MTASSGATRAQTRTVLESAARASLRAPSVFNTQPWSWRITADVMELRADPDRRLTATDPGGRLLLISLGAALHHARTALAADGWAVTVDRLPDKDQPDLTARVRLSGRAPADSEARQLVAAISWRRTDRRAFGERPVAEETITGLRRLVEAEGAYLHLVPHDDVPILALSAEHAGDAERGDPTYRSELTHWTNRPGLGMPAGLENCRNSRSIPASSWEIVG